MSYAVHFKSKEVGSKLVLGVSVWDGFEEMPFIAKERPAITGSFLEEEALAFKMALETILEEGYDDVMLYNQNKLIFDWLGRESHDNKMRDTIYKQIIELMYAIADEGIQISYTVIKGKDNEAQKQLKEYTKDMVEIKNLTEMFKRKEDNNNVIDFSREAR